MDAPGRLHSLKSSGAPFLRQYNRGKEQFDNNNMQKSGNKLDWHIVVVAGARSLAACARTTYSWQSEGRARLGSFTPAI